MAKTYAAAKRKRGYPARDMGQYIAHFWERVNKTDSCWLWTGALHSAGYGVFRMNCRDGKPGELIYAHRFSYEQHKGKIPAGLHLDHLCRVRNCVNPFHLEAVTSRENNMRGMSMAAKNAVKTHCIKGHQLAGDNLYIRPDTGHRQCRTCRAETIKGWYEKNRKPQNAESQSLETV